MSEQAATYALEAITPAVAAQRASDELSALHDALALAVGRLSGLGPEAEAAMGTALALTGFDLPTYRVNLATLLDDADAARVEAASRVDAALRAEGRA